MDLRLALASVSLVLGAGCGARLTTSNPDDAGADVSLPGRDGGGGDAAEAGAEAGADADAAGPVDAGDAGDAEAGGDGACSLPAPVNRRRVPAVCDATRPPGIEDGGPGPCNTDAVCTGDAGTNGRCTPNYSGWGPTCTYDTCTTDTGCASGTICVCGTPAPGPGRNPNTCLPSNCVVDSDCGPGGSCSPSFGTCGTFSGVVGYYCHEPCDACTNDDQCPAATQGPGYCAWNPQVGQWACSNSICAG